MTETKTLVIATTNVERGIYIIAKDAIYHDELEIHFTEKYAPTVEYVLKFLRKGFGWSKIEEGTKEVSNTKCRFNFSNHCANKELTNDGKKIKCTEQIRNNCEKYKSRYSNSITVNYIVIEKAGGIRGM